MKMLLSLFLLISQFAYADLPTPKAGFSWESLSLLPIQHRGRMKPFNTYARETVQFITGKPNWNQFPPEEVIWSWLTSFETVWLDVPFISVDYGPLRKEVGLEESRKLFSPKELQDLPKLRKLVQSGFQKQQKKEKSSELEKKAMDLQNRLGLLQFVVAGQDLTILPNPKGIHEAWQPLALLVNREAGPIPYDAAEFDKLSSLMKSLVESYLSGKPENWNRDLPQFSEFLQKDLAKGQVPSVGAMKREFHFNQLRPFRWAWVIYSLAFILLLTFLVTDKKPFSRLGLVVLVSAFAMHTYGFILRCLISGRPPVTNMYESVIWVSWGCMVFAFIIWASYKTAIIPTAASVFTIVALVLADNLPSVLDPNIHPLEPVLRSNFWLTIHVLTITLSYAAFALSLCLGNVVLGAYVFKTDKVTLAQTLTLYMYRAVQIGVVLLAAGTILGGVWADYSWGRFWGWDPKEVWALIALLLYLAVLHGRFSGWLKGFGFVAATILSFMGVLMAWYGVNFVLGVGLHSYGFGTGGVSYVLSYLLAQLAFIIAAYFKYQKFIKTQASLPSIFPK
jgi:cytochrome c-type biogenesis protein CcsB